VKLTSERNAAVLVLVCLAIALILILGLQATKSPSLRLGTTIKDPQEYFTHQLRKHRPLCVSTLTSLGNVRFIYDTRFVLLGHTITSRVFVYRFDTNGTVLDISTHRYWPILHF
jgi:hypothetical protein